MSQPVASPNLTAQVRTLTGKKGARALRRQGRIPAVIYGAGQPPELLSLDQRELTKALHQSGFLSHLLSLETHQGLQRVLVRELQLDPVSETPLHVDFLRTAPEMKIVVEVPCRFINQSLSPGLRRGGVLNIVRHDVEVRCSAADIPEVISCDLGGLDIGQSLHIGQVDLPKGVQPTSAERDFTIATIIAPSGLLSEIGQQQG